MASGKAAGEHARRRDSLLAELEIARAQGREQVLRLTVKRLAQVRQRLAVGTWRAFQVLHDEDLRLKGVEADYGAKTVSMLRRAKCERP